MLLLGFHASTFFFPVNHVEFSFKSPPMPLPVLTSDFDMVKAELYPSSYCYMISICCLSGQQVIRESIVGLGTDEDSLTRAIVTRAEIDAMKIREQYSNLYKTSLEDDVIGDTSGDYKNFLLTLLGVRL